MNSVLEILSLAFEAMKYILKALVAAWSSCESFRMRATRVIFKTTKLHVHFPAFNDFQLHGTESKFLALRMSDRMSSGLAERDATLHAWLQFLGIIDCTQPSVYYFKWLVWIMLSSQTFSSNHNIDHVKLLPTPSILIRTSLSPLWLSLYVGFLISLATHCTIDEFINSLFYCDIVANKHSVNDLVLFWVG